jgi:hypothetical protein
MPEIIDISVKSPDEDDHFITVKMFQEAGPLRKEARRLNEENPGPHDVYEDTMGLFSPEYADVFELDIYENEDDEELYAWEIGNWNRQFWLEAKPSEG